MLELLLNKLYLLLFYESITMVVKKKVYDEVCLLNDDNSKY